MIVKTRLLFLICALLSLLGCSSLLVSKTEAPIYYQLSYEAPSVSCSHSFGKGLRIWNFTGFSPYDQTQMVVEKPNGQTLFSNKYQWVAEPGTMISQSLIRDLSAGSLFSRVVSGDDPSHVALEMSGRVFEFVWRRSDTSSRAALNIVVNLTEPGENARVLFRKTYRLQSPPFAEDTSQTFADAASDLVAEFSKELSQDLCKEATSFSRE